MNYGLINKNNTIQIKGILVLLLFFHHIYQVTSLFSGTYIGFALQSLGYFAVAGFFMLSGYGLMVSFNIKGIDYIKQLPIRKIFPLYFINAILVPIYLFVSLLKQNTPVHAADIWQSFLIGRTIVGNGWYLQVQILLYLLFFFSFYKSKSTIRSIITVSCLCVLYMVLAKCFGLSERWFISVPAFVVGIIIALPKFNSALNIKKLYLWFVGFGLLVLTLGLYLIGKLLSVKWLSFLFVCIAAIMFALSIIILEKLINTDFGFIRFFGKISLEFYLCQGLVMTFFHSSFINIKNNIIYVIVCFIITLIISKLFHIVTKYIFSLGKRIENNSLKEKSNE